MVMASDLTTALNRLSNARPAIRPALHASAVAMALELAHERDTLVQRLETRWTWLDQHQGHSTYNERENAVLDDLRAYESMEDVLLVAADVLFGEAA